MKRTQRKRNSIVLNFRISPEEREALERLAESEDRSVGGIVRKAVRLYIALEAAGQLSD